MNRVRRRLRIKIVRCLLYLVTWVSDSGTYTSERCLHTVLMSELPLCLTRHTSVTLKPLFQQLVSEISYVRCMIEMEA